MAKHLIRNPTANFKKGDKEGCDPKCEEIRKYLNDKSTPNTLDRVKEIIRGKPKPVDKNGKIK